MRIMGGMFKRGYSAVHEEKEKQEKARENLGKRLFRFFISNDGEEADVLFLTEDPINFYEHQVQEGGKWVSYTCTQDDNCPFCNNGDRATFKSAFLVWDKRPFEKKDDSGKKKTIEGSLKLFSFGTRVVSQLDRIASKYGGLAGREVTIARMGKGTNTTYQCDRGEKHELTRKEIEGYLPEKLREDYNGTADSLYKIVEEQLMMNVKGFSSNNSDEDDEAPISDTSNKIISVDEEETTPVVKKSGNKKLFRKAK